MAGRSSVGSFINNAQWTDEGVSMAVASDGLPTSTPGPSFTPTRPAGTATALARITATPNAYATAVARLTAIPQETATAVAAKTSTVVAHYTATLIANVTAVAKQTATATAQSGGATETATVVAGKTAVAIANVPSGTSAYSTAVAKVTASAKATATAFTNATATALARETPAKITISPLGETVPVSSTVNLYAAASGKPAPNVQWQVDPGSGWVDVDPSTYTVGGDANNTLTFMASWSENSYQFRALFSNDAGGAVTKAGDIDRRLGLVATRPR